jgi:hypothetical protein
MTELAERHDLLDVQTGEVLPATVENAHRVLTAAREMKQRLQGVVDGATAYLLEESRIQGTKTFHTAAGDLTLTGGQTVEYDPADLAEALRVAGCPEDRIDAVVKATVTYKVDRSVLRQLVAANPDYEAAADLAKRQVEKPYRAATK